MSEQEIKVDIELLKTGKFTFTPEYLAEKYKTEVVPIIQKVVDNQPDKDLPKYQNLMKKYYS